MDLDSCKSYSQDSKQCRAFLETPRAEQVTMKAYPGTSQDKHVIPLRSHIADLLTLRKGVCSVDEHVFDNAVDCYSRTRSVLHLDLSTW